MIAKKIKKPPITVVFDGTSFIPSIGSQTQNIPPITSVNDSNCLLYTSDAADE